MAELKRCKKCGKIYSWNSYFNGYMCECGNIERRAITNADRIRAMSDEELAWELMTWRLETEAKHQGIESNCPNTQSTILEWLQQPAEVKDNA